MKTLVGLLVAAGLCLTASASSPIWEETISLGRLQVTVWSLTTRTTAR